MVWTGLVVLRRVRAFLRVNLHRSALAPGMALSLAATLSTAGTAIADLLDVPLEQLGEIEITTAAKVVEPLQKTAASVNVITAEELRRAGARTLYDALERLPGLSHGPGQFGEHFIAVRGIRSTWSEKVLLLLDGHLLNDARSGSATFQFLDSLPVDNIARIEVVRGPGSALYGANAFLGVINIITKRPEAIGGVEAAASGEFESAGTVAGRYNLLAGGDLGGDWKGNLNLNWLNAPGPELAVDADAFGRAGTADTHVKRLDMQGSMGNGPFTLRGRFLTRDAGDGFGALAVLNDQSRQQVEYGFLDAEYHAKPTRETDLTVRAYLDKQDTDNYYEVPAGTIPPGSFLFPWNTTGLIGNSLAKETITGFEARADHRGITGHTLTAGLGWRRERLHDPRFRANIDPDPLPQVTDVSSYYNWIDPAERDIASLYAQDLWDIRPDLRATLGARVDRYSDFGSAFNPRAGLTWQISPPISARLTYGRAFRAPSVFEQYSKNNPLQQGNPDLDPEEMATWEAGVHWQGGPAQAGVTVFRSDLSNLIDFHTGSEYRNLGETRVQGVEMEGRYRLGGGAEVAANVTLAEPEYTDLEPPTTAPRRQLNVMVDTPLSTGMHWNLHAHWQSETPRTGSDARPPVESAWWVNTALTLKRAPWDFTAAIYNLTGADTAAAAPANTLPGDYPAPGRSFVVGVRYAF
jgi:iron complex outermembrane receptor protein